MKKKLLSTLLAAVSSLILNSSLAGTCVGPSPCPDNPPDSSPQLCIDNRCSPVTYFKYSYPNENSYFVIAVSQVYGYPVLGWNGPCLANWDCPAIYEGAFNDLYINASRAHRVFRFLWD